MRSLAPGGAARSCGLAVLQNLSFKYASTLCSAAGHILFSLIELIFQAWLLPTTGNETIMITLDGILFYTWNSACSRRGIHKKILGYLKYFNMCVVPRDRIS